MSSRVRLLAAVLLLAGCDQPVAEPRAPLARMLTITGMGRGDGRVVSSPQGIDCVVRDGAATGACIAPFDSGVVVSLTATVEGESRFSGWSGRCVGAAACTLTMDATNTAVATFDGPTLRILAGAFPSGAIGTGRGGATIALQPTGATCRIAQGVLARPCEITTRPGELMSLTVTPDSGEVGVIQWSAPSTLPLLCGPLIGGSGTSVTRFVCAGSLSRAEGELRLNVFRNYLSVSRASTASGNGRVTDRALGIDCEPGASILLSSGTCGADVAEGQPVSLVFVPQGATLFQGWSSPCTSASSPTCTFTMRAGRQSAVLSTRSLFP